MDEDSRTLLKINAHRWLYRFDRLPFWLKSAPRIFQQQIDTLVAGLEGTAAYLDDIIGRHFTTKTTSRWYPFLEEKRECQSTVLIDYNAILLNYYFKIEFFRTSDFGQPDALSRLMVSHSPEPEDKVIAVIDSDTIAEIPEIPNEILAVAFKAVQIATLATVMSTSEERFEEEFHQLLIESDEESEERRMKPQTNRMILTSKRSPNRQNEQGILVMKWKDKRDILLQLGTMGASARTKKGELAHLAIQEE
ncbi:hypothetical protein TELCIR_03705 [Teladorsagia circumcincta]|uniref:Uncharacterized protein n=1 Tax=Teladorsagia circumcincta TaxID=45464 RepID=A0A2G9UVM7_TELCI|nr:hypothetical protein TELCIR_03705 [Teladorsagia circumcincta]